MNRPGLVSWKRLELFSSSPVRTPRLTIRCEYPDLGVRPTEVSFGLSPRYGILDAREAHEWFLKMMAENEEFEVETDVEREWPVPFWSETVRRVACF